MRLESCEPINHWIIIMQGPESGACGKLYEGQVFRLQVKFPGNQHSYIVAALSSLSFLSLPLSSSTPLTAPSHMPSPHHHDHADNYPLNSPEVTFLPEAPMHPHIYSNGHICLDVLYDGANGGWSPALTVNKLCLR